MSMFSREKDNSLREQVYLCSKVASLDHSTAPSSKFVESNVCVCVCVHVYSLILLSQ